MAQCLCNSGLGGWSLLFPCRKTTFVGWFTGIPSKRRLKGPLSVMHRSWVSVRRCTQIEAESPVPCSPFLSEAGTSKKFDCLHRE